MCWFQILISFLLFLWYFWHFRPFCVKKNNFWSKIGIYHKLWQRAGTSLLQCKYDEHNLQITEQYTETCKILPIFHIFGLKLPLFGKKFIFWDSPGAGGEFVSIFECTVSPMILSLYVSRRFWKVWMTSLYLYTFPRIQDGVQNGRHFG